MARAVRWQFALPWILVLIAVLIVAQIVLARLVRTAVQHTGEESVGARVDVGDARVSFLGRSITLRQIAVANPHAPLRNLVEAERCDLHVEAGALLHKRTIVDRGSLTGICFGTSRDSSGLLPGAAEDATALTGWLDEPSLAAAQAWLDRLHEQFAADLVAQLQSIRLTEELLARWPEQHAAVEVRVRELRQRTVEFQAAVRKAQSNPLRHVEFLERMPEEIKDIQADLTKLSADVQNLPSTMDDDRRAIVAARQHDEQFLREHLKFERIDTNVLTAYLLQEQLAEPLADLMGWLRWMRHVLPADSAPSVASHRRGEDVLFAGCAASPDLLIRALDLRGTAQIGGRQLELLGTVTDFASQPRRHDQPLCVRLTTNGPLPLQLQATLDRTGPVARDQLLVDCAGIVLPKLRLGRSDKLRLSLEPSSASLNVSITIEGDRLSGDIQLVQKQVQITPTVADELARAGVDTALGESLGRIRSLATRVSIRGTLDEPQCQLWSNIGPAVAEAMDRALARTAESYSRQLVAESQQRVDERLAELDRRIGDQQAAMFPQLADSSVVVGALSDSEERPLRLSIEHLGRRLPADSLFR